MNEFSNKPEMTEACWMENPQRRCLQIVLFMVGILFLSLYPLMLLWPSGWVWLPRQYEYEQMMIGVYGTLGIFLMRASRRPEGHLSLLWFTFWSSLIHGMIMGIQAIADPLERGHLVGDVAALFAVVVLLGWLIPRGAVREAPETYT
jgi:hypothetical protein